MEHLLLFITKCLEKEMKHIQIVYRFCFEPKTNPNSSWDHLTHAQTHRGMIFLSICVKRRRNLHPKKKSILTTKRTHTSAYGGSSLCMASRRRKHVGSKVQGGTAGDWGQVREGWSLTTITSLGGLSPGGLSNCGVKWVQSCRVHCSSLVKHVFKVAPLLLCSQITSRPTKKKQQLKYDSAAVESISHLLWTLRSLCCLPLSQDPAGAKVQNQK